MFWRPLLMMSLLLAPSSGFGKEGVLELYSGPSLCAASWVGQDGEVLTAYHCVLSRRRLVLVDSDGKRWLGRVVGVDRDLDLALVRPVSGQGEVGFEVRAEALKVGEAVEVWGHPSGSSAAGVPALEGLLFYSRFSGAVSAVGSQLVQLDMAFNPGISGGPVLDEEGRVVGVASRKLKGEHLSFASPVSDFLREGNPSASKPVLSGHLGARIDLEMPLGPSGVSSIHLVPQLVLWDWLVFETGLGLSLGQTRGALERKEVRWRESRTALFLRGRLGWGPESLTVDVGPHLSGHRSLLSEIEEEVIRFVPRLHANEPGVAVQVGWRGWTMGVNWTTRESENEWAITLGARALNNLVLF